MPDNKHFTNFAGNYQLPKLLQWNIDRLPLSDTMWLHVYVCFLKLPAALCNTHIKL